MKNQRKKSSDSENESTQKPVKIEGKKRNGNRLLD